MLGWEAGQLQPDSVAVATIAFETLAASSAARVTLSVPSGRLSQHSGRPTLPRVVGGQVLPFNPLARRIGR
jgi:hypothetical protein